MSRNVKYLGVAIFWLAFLAPFPVQINRHLCSSGYGGYFDEPGSGWVALYGTMLGGVCAIFCSLIYLAFSRRANGKKVAALLFCALILLWPLNWLLTDKTQEARNHLIRMIAYGLFYAPTANFVPSISDEPVPPGIPYCLPPRTECLVDDGSHEILMITTGNGLLRKYTWEGASRAIVMAPVEVSGIKQLNYPSDLANRKPRWPGFDWKLHNGIARCCSSESVINFSSKEAAVEWISHESSENYPSVYTSTGLVVQWSRHIEPDTLWIMVHQVLVNGKRPSHLKGANDAALTLRSY